MARYRSQWSFITALILSFFCNLSSSQLVAQIDCKGMVVYNYTRGSTPLYENFRTLLINELNCPSGQLIDHTRYATLDDLTSNTRKDDAPEKIKASIPAMEKVFFLEYNPIAGDKNLFIVFAQIVLPDGKLLSGDSKRFDAREIEQNTDEAKAQIRQFLDGMIGRDPVEEGASFKYLTKFNILITNFNDISSCPNNARAPELVLEDAVNIQFGNEIVEVLVDKGSLPIKSAYDAQQRGRIKKADIVIWTNDYDIDCQVTKASLKYEITGRNSVPYLEQSGASPKGPIDRVQRDFLTDEIGRIIFWKLGQDAYNGGKFSAAVKFLKKLSDQSLKTPTEKAEKYFLLGQSYFTTTMDLATFNECKINFNKSIGGNGDNKRRQYWLQLLELLKNNPLLKKAVEQEYNIQANRLLNSISEYFPSSEEEFLYCIRLANRLDKRDKETNELISSAPKKSFKVLIALMQYYDARGEESTAEGFANRLVEQFNNRPEGYDYLANINEKRKDWDKALSYARKVAELTYHNGQNELRLARLYESLSKRDSCQYHYLKANELQSNLKDIAIERYLGFDKAPVNPNTLAKKGPDCSGYELEYRVNETQTFGTALNYFRSKFGVRLSEQIRQLNRHFKLNSRINRNTILKVTDGSQAITHKVLFGEGLIDIVLKYKAIIPNLSISKLKALNGLENADRLCDEQILLIHKGCFTETITLNSYVTRSKAAQSQQIKLKNIDESALKTLNGRVDAKCRKKIWVVKL